MIPRRRGWGEPWPRGLLSNNGVDPVATLFRAVVGAAVWMAVV